MSFLFDASALLVFGAVCAYAGYAYGATVCNFRRHPVLDRAQLDAWDVALGQAELEQRRLISQGGWLS